MGERVRGENGEEKLIAAAREIVKSLGHTDSMTQDILHVYSTFDRRIPLHRLSADADADDFTTDINNDNNIMSLSQSEYSSVLLSIDRRLSPLLSSDTPIWSISAADATSFLSAVDDLLAAIADWFPLSHDDRSLAASLNRADDLLHQAMFRLESEFRSLLEHPPSPPPPGLSSGFSSEEEEEEEEEAYADDDIPVARPVTDYNLVIDALPAGTIADLHDIATRMVLANYTTECSHVYSACRRDFLDESLSRLGLHRLTIDEVQKAPWSDLELEITRWTKAAVVALRILFPSERLLCDRVFSGFPSAADLSFMELCRGPAFHIFSFADAVAIASRAPERLFRVLDLYETLRDLIPEFDFLFSNQYCAALRTEAIAIWKRLGDSIRGIFRELENLIRRDPAKQPLPGGAVHPITRYVMNYVRAACKSRSTLEQVFEDFSTPSSASAAASGSTSLSIQMAWIMDLLQTNLDAKSKLYRDPALSSIFMMNNGRYILQKLTDNDLGELLGDDWIRKHNAKVRQLYVTYQRTSWNKVLGSLRMDDATVDLSGRERLRLFNTYFDDTCKAQSTWVVFDDQIKEELKISVASNLSSAYRNFLGWFHNSAERGRNADRYIKYTVDDIEARIHNELFQGGRK